MNNKEKGMKKGQIYEKSRRKMFTIRGLAF